MATAVELIGCQPHYQIPNDAPRGVSAVAVLGVIFHIRRSAEFLTCAGAP
jgi:hypothetical protein